MKYLAHNIICFIFLLVSCSSDKVEEFYNRNKDKDLSTFKNVSISRRSDNYVIWIYYDTNSDSSIYFYLKGYPKKEMEILNSNKDQELKKYSKVYNVKEQDAYSHAMNYCHDILTEFNDLGKIIGTKIYPEESRNVIKFYLSMEDFVYYVGEGYGVPRPFQQELQEAKKLGDHWFYYKANY